MHQTKFILGILLASIFSGVFTLGGYLMLQEKEVEENISEKQKIVLSSYKKENTDFEYEKYVPQGLNFMLGKFYLALR